MVTSNKAFSGLIALILGCFLLYIRNFGIDYTIPASPASAYYYFGIIYYVEIAIIPMIIFGGLLLFRDRVGGAKLTIIGGFILLGLGIINTIILNNAVSYIYPPLEYLVFRFHMLLEICILPILITIGGFIGLGSESE